MRSDGLVPVQSCTIACSVKSRRQSSTLCGVHVDSGSFIHAFRAACALTSFLLSRLSSISSHSCDKTGWRVHVYKRYSEEIRLCTLSCQGQQERTEWDPTHNERQVRLIAQPEVRARALIGRIHSKFTCRLFQLFECSGDLHDLTHVFNGVPQRSWECR